MFKMIDEPEFETEAKGTEPGGEAFSFKARFKALSESVQQLFDLSTAAGTVDFLRTTFVGLSDVLDANDQPVPFTTDVRDWMIDRPHTRAALVKAYFGSVYGEQLGN